MLSPWRDEGVATTEERDAEPDFTSEPVFGSTNGVGQRFRSFGIDDLELVGQTSASWNQVIGWLSHIDCLRDCRIPEGGFSNRLRRGATM